MDYKINEYGEIINENQNEIPEKPKNYMALSIISILFSLIIGIIAIIYAAKVNSLWKKGRYEEAQKASAAAQAWSIIGIVVGGMLTLIRFCMNL